MWTDKAILLTVSQVNRKTLKLETLTKSYGRDHSLLPISAGSAPVLLPGAFLELEFKPGLPGEPSLATLLNQTGGLIPDDDDDPGIPVLIAVNELLGSLLPQNEPFPRIFNALERLMTSLATSDGRWPVYYSILEFSLVSSLGHVTGIEQCMPAHRHGETIYMSPRSGRAVTREQGGAFLDRLMPVPGVLMGSKNAVIADVRHAMELNTLMLTRFALPAAQNASMPTARDNLTKMIAATKTLPPEQKREPEIDEEARKRRIGSMRKLMVASASNAVAS